MRAIHPILAGILYATVAGQGAIAADTATPDWPCIQRKVPTISAAMMWGGPQIDEAALTAWRKDKDVARLVPRLAARRTALADAEKLVAGFASPLVGSDKSQRLTLLFAGVLDRINIERRRIMAGIERFTRKQRALADSISETRKALADVLAVADPDEKQVARRRELEQTLAWQSRIYEERERSLKYVCESPVLLEQRAFAIARLIMNYLD